MVNTEEISNLLTKILMYLVNNNKIKLYRFSKGIIVNINDENKIYIGSEYINMNEFENLEFKNALLHKISPIDEIMDTLETLLSSCICVESFKYGNALEDLKNNIKGKYGSSPPNSKNKNKNKVPVPLLKGVRLIDFPENNKRIILLRDYPINTVHTYEEPMISNLSKLWRGHKLHKNFVIIEINKKGHNIKCEFDCIGVVDDILCIFELKNRNKSNLSHFLEQINLHSKYIIKWLLKNKIDVKYIAPVVYIKESKEFHNETCNDNNNNSCISNNSININNNDSIIKKMNIIYYEQVLNHEQLKINKLYKINPITDEVSLNEQVNKEIIISKIPNESNEHEPNKKELNTLIDKIPSYQNIMIKKEHYNKINKLVETTDLFDSVKDFIEFALNSAFTTIELLKLKKIKW